MLLKPDEVANLKKGKQVFVEVKEGDVRLLKRNFCGVYQLYPRDFPEKAEYFEDLTLFKNRYGSIHKKFSLYNLSRQRLDIFPVAENMCQRDIFKWFGEYGKIIYLKSTKVAGLEISYYNWISDTENTLSSFQIIRDGDSFTMNISLKNKMKAAS